jgi:hypothetical protein
MSHSTRTYPDGRERRITGYQTVVKDDGVKDKRLMVVEPEFAAPLRVSERDGNTLSAVVRQAWDTGRLRVLTKNFSTAHHPHGSRKEGRFSLQLFRDGSGAMSRTVP